MALGVCRRPGDLKKVQIEHIPEIVNIYIQPDCFPL
jgi:hypothetical protein